MSKLYKLFNLSYWLLCYMLLTPCSAMQPQEHAALLLREPSMERIAKKEETLRATLSSVNKRRTTTYVVGGICALGGIGWGIYTYLNQDLTAPAAAPAIPNPQVPGDFYHDYIESRKLGPQIKNGLIVGLSTGIVAFLLKRMELTWNKTTEHSQPLIQSFWGHDEHDLMMSYGKRFYNAVVQLQDAINLFKQGIIIQHTSVTRDEQLKRLHSINLAVAWKSVITTFEDLVALFNITGQINEQESINQCMQNTLEILYTTIGWAENLLQAPTINQEQLEIETLGLSQKLSIVTKQLIDQIIV